MTNGEYVYWILIGFSIIIILSFGFNFLAKKTNIPSVLMLILTGFIIGNYLPVIDEYSTIIDTVVKILGHLGVVMIVLEAALDLKLVKSKAKLIGSAFLIALLLLVFTSAIIGWGISFLFQTSFYDAMAYSIPLSIMSSAIIIPSVANLSPHKKEFLIFEAAFSDILGLMFFYFLIGARELDSPLEISLQIMGNIGITVVIALVVSVAIILLIQKVTAQIKLFLPLAALMLVYFLGKLYHLSSLIIVLTFGLMINNKDIFFRGKLKKFFSESSFNTLLDEIKLLTLESSFLVRTLFFVVFGMTISLKGLGDISVIITSLLTLGTIYFLRFVAIRSIMDKCFLVPAVYVAPRGLITILLFFAIPVEMQIERFQPTILLLTIIVSSLIMMFGLVGSRNQGGRKEIIRSVAKHHDPIVEDSTTPADRV